MRIVNSLLASLALGLAMLTPQPLGAQERIENPEGAWTHQQSGTVFPRFLAAAERGSITEFDDAANDIGVGYAMSTPDGLLTLTIYIYPVIAGFDCMATYEDAKLAIDQYPGATVRSQGTKRSPGGTLAEAALYARYDIPEGAMRAGHPAMVSDLYLYCPPATGKLVKYRASWTGSAESFPDVGALIGQVAWGEGLD